MRKFIFIVFLFLLAGCSSMTEESDPGSGNGEHGDIEMNKVRYDDATDKNMQGYERHETMDEMRRQDRGYEPDNSRYTNEDTAALRDHLMDRRDIRGAQTVENDDRTFIAVQLAEHADRETILDTIEKEAEPFIPPEKDIVIYTDDIYWDRMRDLKSRMRHLTDDDAVDEYIDEYFD